MTEIIATLSRFLARNGYQVEHVTQSSPSPSTPFAWLWVRTGYVDSDHNLVAVTEAVPASWAHVLRWVGL